MAADDNIDAMLGQHGGNLAAIAARYPDAAAPYIDLSTSINPYPYPFPAIKNEWLSRLAEPGAMRAAEQAAGRYYGGQAVLAAGMQPLMLALAALRLHESGPSRVGVVTPTYSEHAPVWRALGHAVVEAKAIGECDVAIVCNPNNPDGKIIQAAELMLLATRVDWLIIDESFGDLIPGMGMAGARDNIIVLRSCGKFFGAAGLRVSAAITSESRARWLRDVMGPWPVSTAACHILPVMLDDVKWTEAMREKLAEEALEWRGVLARYFTPVGYTDLFTLVEHDDAAGWHAHLMQAGILARRFDYNPRWLRFGLPGKSQVARIEAALAAYA